MAFRWYSSTVERGRRIPERARGLSFGSVADQYERYRLDYPDELADAVLEYAGRPVGSALEVGAGTGKATRLFASRGVHVTALEPDAGMARVLQRTTRGLPVEGVVTTFERFETTRRFDLLYAAASWHWTDPGSRWARAVGMLAPGGVLALFGSPAELKDPALFAAVDEIEQQVLPHDEGDAAHPWSVDEMAAVDGLTDVTRRDFDGATTTTAEGFLGRLATVSAYLALNPQARTEALRRVAAVLPDHVEIDAAGTLFLARRA
jgi:SAM-dependent methyltransferase